MTERHDSDASNDLDGCELRRAAMPHHLESLAGRLELMAAELDMMHRIVAAAAQINRRT